MKEYIQLALISFVIIILYFFGSDDSEEIITDSYKATKEYVIPDIKIKVSSIGGRGIFSNRIYNKGEIIEVCPCIQEYHKYSQGTMNNYVFDYKNRTNLIGFGYCSMYNHMDKPNAEWTILNKNQIQIVALKQIQKGEEIFISYGPDYFKDRGMDKN
jgi:SET domain-containing protein